MQWLGRTSSRESLASFDVCINKSHSPALIILPTIILPNSGSDKERGKTMDGKMMKAIARRILLLAVDWFSC